MKLLSKLFSEIAKDIFHLFVHTSSYISSEVDQSGKYLVYYETSSPWARLENWLESRHFLDYFYQFLVNTSAAIKHAGIMM